MFKVANRIVPNVNIFPWNQHFGNVDYIKTSFIVVLKKKISAMAIYSQNDQNLTISLHGDGLKAK